MGSKLTLETSAPVDAAVIFQEPVDGLLNGFEGRGGSGIIQVDIGLVAAIQEGDLGIQADEEGAEG
jgi:hypothetical protein